MAKIMGTVGEDLAAPQLDAEFIEASKVLEGLIDANAYVGEVYSLGYDEALVQIHDFHRQQVGGIPALSFLAATRIKPGGPVDIREEDSSVILLRVLDHADLPNAQEALRVRVETAQRVSGEERSWDDRDVMDATTHHLLSYAGVRCRVLGTFYVAGIGEGRLALSFGSDLSNYYPNRGLKVYEPRGDVLAGVVNYRDPRTHAEEHEALVPVGEVRYASTNRPFQQIADVRVSITPIDLLGQKTALFGMTRMGKSNTTKIVLKSIFALRWAEHPLRIGQIVFDPDGEYANENAQDADHKQNPNAIKNVWAAGPAARHAELKEDVVTYGITKHPNDPDRKLMLLNFQTDGNLEIGKQIIDSALAADNSIYIKNFRDVRLEPPEASDISATTRHKRRVLFYRALLFKAGLRPSDSLSPTTKGLFNKEFLDKMSKSGGKDASAAQTYNAAAAILAKPTPSWAEVAQAAEALRAYVADGDSSFGAFDLEYVKRAARGHGRTTISRRSLRCSGTPTGPGSSVA